MAKREATIVISGDTRMLRAMVGKAAQKWVAMTPYEERVIADEFVRLARDHVRRTSKAKPA